MNIYDISKQSGVSIATVSRVINNSGYVAEKTRKKVMEVIEKNSYSPNAFARGMSTSSMKTVGILTTNIRDLYQAQCVYYLEQDLKKHSYTAMLCCTGDEQAAKKEHVELLASRSVDALIFIGSHFVEKSEKDNGYIYAASNHIPVFLLNGCLSHSNIYSILCDDEKGCYELTKCALDHGAKSPYFLATRDTFSVQRKWKGFKKACKEHDIEIDDSRFRLLEDGFEQLGSQVFSILQDTDIDAAICVDDEIASIVEKVADYCKRKVPRDLQITGYNDSIFAKLAHPAISSFDNRTAYMCSQAIYGLVQVLEGKEFPEETMYTGKVVLRHSTND